MKLLLSRDFRLNREVFRIRGVLNTLPQFYRCRTKIYALLTISSMIRGCREKVLNCYDDFQPPVLDCPKVGSDGMIK